VAPVGVESVPIAGQVIKNLSEADMPPGMFEEREVDFSEYTPEETLSQDDEEVDEGVVGSEGGSDADTDTDADAEVDAPVAKTKAVTKSAFSPTTTALEARHGQKYRFVITVLDASDINVEFVDVFCQFRFLNKSTVSDAAKPESSSFSTESIQNADGNLAFYHPQQVCVDITDRFLEYLEKEVLAFELFGHYESHPLHTSLEGSGAASSPLKGQLLAAMGDKAPPQGPTLPAHTLLVWYELCELNSSGLYSPVDVGKCHVLILPSRISPALPCDPALHFLTFCTVCSYVVVFGRALHFLTFCFVCSYVVVLQGRNCSGAKLVFGGGCELVAMVAIRVFEINLERRAI
jgi:hypothetical protein